MSISYWWSSDGDWFCILADNGVDKATVSLTPQQAEQLAVAAIRPDAGGWVREAEHKVERILTRRVLQGRVDGYTLETSKEIVAALSTPPAAAESSASVEARLREALIALDERLRSCGSLHTAEDAYDSFYQEIVSEALSAAGDEAKKSDGVPGKQSASGAAAAPIETEDAGVAIRPSDLTTDRRRQLAEDWKRQIINAGGDENVAQQAVALAALNGLFDHCEVATAERREIVARDLGVLIDDLHKWADEADSKGERRAVLSVASRVKAILAALDGGKP